jgi:Beta-propeller repeat
VPKQFPRGFNRSRSKIAAVAAVIAVALVLVFIGVSEPESNPSYEIHTRAAAQRAEAASAEQQSRIRARMGRLPLAFEANRGQSDPQVEYLARAVGYTLFLTRAGAVFSFPASSSSSHAERLMNNRLTSATPARAKSDSTKSAHGTGHDSCGAIGMKLIGANAQPSVTSSGKLAGAVNYFLGNDRARWHTGVPQYARVSYQNVYPGVEMAFHGEQRQLEFDFIVAGGADSAPIELGFSGARNVSTDAAGNLLLSSSAGKVMLHRPVAYQEKNGVRQSVDARFVVRTAAVRSSRRYSDKQVGFALGDYDHSSELVIDPSVTYATYLGGTAEDDGLAIAIDHMGDAFVTGQTESTNFPGASTVNSGGFDVFVTEIAPEGSKQLYSAYIGGTGDDSGNAIAVDPAGDAFVAGSTASSTNFPTSKGSLQSTFGGGMLDGFVFELNPTGSELIYSTYLGGGGDDVANGIAFAIDGTGNVSVAGSTTSTNFPTAAALQANIAGTKNGFVSKLNSTLSTLVYSTYLGGGAGDFASAIAVDTVGNAYVTGATQNPGFPTKNPFQPNCGSDGTCNGGLQDAFVTVYNPTGSAYVYSTFLGGSENDTGLGIAVDVAGEAFVTGQTTSSDFPKKSALQPGLGGPSDGFITRLSASGSALVYSTFLGGSGNDAGTGIAVDAALNTYVTGLTASTNFPTASATQGTPGGGNDAFVSEINPAGSALLFSTYLGGSLNEDTSAANGGPVGAIAVDGGGANFYVSGLTSSTDFPTKSPLQAANGGAGDAFVTKYTQPVTGPDFTVTGTALPAVNPGAPATSTITVAAVNGYTGTVQLGCNIAGTTAIPTCSFSPSTIMGGAGTSTLTLTTSGQAALVRPTKIFYAAWLPVLGISLLGIRMGNSGRWRGRKAKLLLLGILLMAIFLLPSCASKNNGGGGGGCSGCTPAGNYNVIVTGTDSVNPNLANSISPSLILSVN